MSSRAFLIRLATVLVMAALLLVLSVIFRKALASSSGGGVAYAWTSWFVATVLAFWMAFTAPGGRSAFGRLCLLDGIAAGLLLGVVTAYGATGAISSDLLGRPPTVPVEPALGGALLSAALGIVAVVLFVGAYLLLHSRGHGKGHAMKS